MAGIFNADPQAPTNRTFHLKCQVHCKNIGYDDKQSKGSTGNTEANMCFLEPLDSSQCWSFFSAWMPESENECVEIICTGERVGQFRAAVRRADRRFPKPHLFVMTVEVEEALAAFANEHNRNFPNEKPILSVTVHPETDTDYNEG
jgi:hypothetical protein